MNLIIGTSHQAFGKKLADKYQNIHVIDTTISKFSNGEIRVLINETIRGEDIFILETGVTTKNPLDFCDNVFQNMREICIELEESKSMNRTTILRMEKLKLQIEDLKQDSDRNINDTIMETLILIDACVSAGVNSVTLLFLNYPYARQDKRIGRESIAAKMLATCLTKCKVSRVATVDLHASQIQGFFGVTCDNLYALKTLCEYFKKHHFAKINSNRTLDECFILVSPDNGGAKRIAAYSKRLEINNVIMHKERNYSISSTIDNMTIVGSLDKIKGKTAIIVDDMIDTAGTMISAAKILVENDVKNVIIAATHGIFSGKALERLNNCSEITEVIVTNTIPQRENQALCSKIKVADVSDLIYDVMKCLETGHSISKLFD